MSDLDVVVLDVPLVVRAVARSREHRLSLWDALIVQAAHSRGCTRLLTEDLQDGRQFGALRVENPFAGV
jgi:predicted nucleic acid-binding protein